MISINIVDIDAAVEINRQIPEFNEHYRKTNFQNRLEGKEHLILAAMAQGIPAGYLIGYNRDDDGSIYCWRAAVLPQFRQQGALKALMGCFEQWAREKGYTKIKIKTRNKRRAMLAYLVKYGFYFVRVAVHEPIEESRIYLEKRL